MNFNPPPVSVIEKTKLQAFKELRTLLSEVLASAVADDEVPEAFKSTANWEKLIAQTENRLAEAWRHRFEAGADRRKAVVLPLDLLPDDEHGQQLLSERFVNDVSYQDRQPLDQLDRQLAALSGEDFDSRSANPLGPSSWVEGIRGGMKLIDCTPEQRDWLLERLIPLLTARMGMFYSGLNARLTSAGVVARPAYGGQAAVAPRSEAYSPELVESVGTRLSPAEAEADGGDGAAGSDPLERLFGLLSARRAPAPGPEAGYGPPPGAWSQPPGQQQPGQWNPGWGAPGFGPGGQGVAPGFSGGPGYGPLPASADGAHAGASPVAPPAPVVPWSQSDIFSILTLLQGSYVANPAAAAGASTMGRLQEAMSSTASQLGLTGAIQAMPGPAQDTLELVSMLFEALLDGRRLDEKARAQLALLIIPYVRVAMLDRRLFMQSSHPARRVLNQLVEAFETAAPDASHYGPLRDLGFSIIDQVVEEFADDLKLFESLEERLSTELESCRRRAEIAERRAGDAQSGKERRELARTSVAGQLSEAIVGKGLPKTLLEFLAGPWQHHQTVILLREGEEGAGVQANRRLLQDLLECSGRGELGDVDAMRPRLSEVLASSGQLGGAVDDLLIDLSVAFASHPVLEEISSEAAQAASEQGLAVAELVHERSATAAEPITDAYVVPAVDAAQLPADIVERYAQAPIGTWLDFIGEDGRVTSAHISWTSPISGRRIISNRRGQRMLVASPGELAEMEIEGRIRPRKAGSPFDQAMHAIADKLESSLPKASHD